MTSDDFIVKQLDQIHEYLRFTGDQAITWSAFGIGVNTAAAWAMLDSKWSFRTNVVPYVFIFGNRQAVLVCLIALPSYYLNRVKALSLLGSRLQSAIDAGDVIAHAAPFSHRLWILIAVLMGLLYLAITFAWAYGIYAGRFVPT
jgi:hypothetical protein